MTENPDKLQRRLEAWLADQGYPLELKVAQQLSAAGAHVVQSDYYEDPDDAGTSREIDVTASWSRWNEDPRTIGRLTLVIECKRSVDKPWVLFTSERAADLSARAAVAQRAVSDYKTLERLLPDPYIQRLPLFRVPNRAGYGATQAFTTGADVVFQAMMCAAKAARATVDAHQGFQKSLAFFEIAFPVVVVEGRIFECYLVEGEIAIAELQRGVVAWRRAVASVGHTFVHVVTPDGLGELIKDAAETADGLLSRLPPL